MEFNQCGECTVCCDGNLVGDAFGHEFYPGKPCEFMDSGKCTTYSVRPLSCIKYQCGWSQKLFSEEHRPDKSGWLVSIEFDQEGKQYLKAIETKPASSIEAIDEIKAFAETNSTYVTIIDHETNLSHAITNANDQKILSFIKPTRELEFVTINGKDIVKGNDLKVNLGCGRKVLPGYVNIDYEPYDYPDHKDKEIINVNLNGDDLPFRESSVSEIIAYHILEHIGIGFLSLMKEIYRVCKNGATIDIVVPHHRHDYFTGDPTHVRPITLEMMSRFSKKANEFDVSSGSTMTPFALLLGVDFEIVKHEYKIDPMFEEIFSKSTPDEINRMARIYNNVITEIHFTMRVNKP
jgi:hypothetical protein